MLNRFPKQIGLDCRAYMESSSFSNLTAQYLEIYPNVCLWQIPCIQTFFAKETALSTHDNRLR